MKKRTPKKLTPIRPLNSLTNPNAAGVDIGSTQIHVCVPLDRDPEYVRIFETFTCALNELRDWLLQCRIDNVAMEATGIYWIPLYEILDAAGIKCVLINPRQIKRDKKTDILDCQLIQQWHSYGLLNGSFRPENQTCSLRSIIRHRSGLIRDRSQHIQHMQKSLHQMNLQLDNVISDITGKTGLEILRCIVAGQQNPKELAKLRDHRCRSSQQEIEKSLEGNYRTEHLFTLQQALYLYDTYTDLIVKCDQKLESLYKELAVNTPEMKALPSKLKKAKKTKDSPSYDLQSLLLRLYGVDLTQIDGISSLTAQVAFSEIGPNVDAFPTVKCFTRWLRLSPDNKITGGRVISAQPQKNKNKLSLALRIAASSLASSRSPLGDHYRKQRVRHGALKANAICAHKLARIIYFLVKYKTQFDPTILQQQTLRDREYAIKKLMNKANKLGFTLTPTLRKQ